VWNTARARTRRIVNNHLTASQLKLILFNDLLMATEHLSVFQSVKIALACADLGSRSEGRTPAAWRYRQRTRQG
jgi:hypothetical protein